MVPAHAAFDNFVRTPNALGLDWAGIENQREIYIDFSNSTAYSGYLDSTLGPAVVDEDDNILLSMPDNEDDEHLPGEQGYLGGASPYFYPIPHSQTDPATNVVSMNLGQTSPASPGLITITLPNTSATDGYKEVWIEWISTSSSVIDESTLADKLTVEAQDEGGAGHFDMEVLYAGHSSDPVAYDEDTYTSWYATNVLLRISPNPQVEVFTFRVPEFGSASPPYYIDSIAIATNCVPEPSTLIVWSVLGVLALAVGRRR
jgi:hypothetical protein